MGAAQFRCLTADESAQTRPLPLLANLTPEDVPDIARRGCRGENAGVWPGVVPERGQRSRDPALAHTVRRLDQHAVGGLEQGLGDLDLARPGLNPEHFAHVGNRPVPITGQVVRLRFPLPPFALTTAAA